MLINLKINLTLSQEGYESSSSSEGEKEFGLSPYMFEPERTPAETENLLKELELKQNSPQEDCPPRNTRIGNMDWCVCSKTCEAMMTETESLCCKEGNDISDELFKGKIFEFFNEFWYKYRLTTFFLRVFLNYSRYLFIE